VRTSDAAKYHVEWKRTSDETSGESSRSASISRYRSSYAEARFLIAVIASVIAAVAAAAIRGNAATPSILNASTDDAAHRTGSLFDSTEKSEYGILRRARAILARAAPKSR